MTSKKKWSTIGVVVVAIVFVACGSDRRFAGFMGEATAFADLA